MTKKLKILFSAIATTIALGSGIVGTTLLVNSNKEETPPIVETKTYEIKLTNNEFEKNNKIIVTVDDEEYSDQQMLIKYNYDENENEIILQYDSEQKYFYCNIDKVESEQILSNVKIIYRDKEYNSKDIVIKELHKESIYTQISLEPKVYFDGCQVDVKMTKPYLFTSDVYINDTFVQQVSIGDGIGFSIPYSDSWLDENNIELRNIEFQETGVYTDESVQEKFKIFIESTLIDTYCEKESVYYFENEMNVIIKLQKTMNFETQKIIINGEEYNVEKNETNNNVEEITISVPLEKMQLENEKYSLNIEKALFTKGTLEINKKLTINRLSEQIEIVLNSSKEYYVNDEEKIFEFNIFNPYGFLITKIEIDDKLIDINSSENQYIYELKTTQQNSTKITKVYYEYNEKEYIFACELEKKVEVVELPTTYEILENIISTETERYIQINFDKTITDKKTKVSFYINAELFEKEGIINEDQKSILVDISEQAFEISTYSFYLNYINVYEEKESTESENPTIISVSFYDEEHKEMELVNYRGVKEISLSTRDSETGEVIFTAETDENVIIKEIVFEIYDDERNVIVEEWNVPVSYNEETKEYVLVSPYDIAIVKIISISYEKDNLTYYTKLPVDEEIIIV